MIGKIIGIILFVLLALFTICSCKVASWVDEKEERDNEEV